MKKFAIILILIFSVTNFYGQSFFTQNATWIKNQIKQIALWQLYIRDLEKGYDVARQGLTAIGDIKNGDFHLHLDQFNSLLQVNPAIKKYSEAIEILQLQSDIKKLVIKSDDTYVNSVWNNLSKECNNDVRQLNMILTAENYQLTDDERIKQIRKLLADMKDKYAFAKTFAEDIKIMSLQELKETNEVKTSRLLNNIKKL